MYSVAFIFTKRACNRDLGSRIEPSGSKLCCTCSYNAKTVFIGIVFRERWGQPSVKKLIKTTLHSPLFKKYHSAPRVLIFFDFPGVARVSEYLSISQCLHTLMQRPLIYLGNPVSFLRCLLIFLRNPLVSEWKSLIFKTSFELWLSAQFR